MSRIAVALKGLLGPDFALDVAFDVPASGVTCLLGPSGSGKTTLLRALAGLVRLDGSVRFADEIWQDGRRFVPTHRRGVGYAVQGGGLLPHLSVAQNLGYAERRAPAGPFVRDEVIARSGIAALLDRSPSRLSGGETQRASIARALLSQPRLLLMDEPLSALDGPARAGLLAWLEELLADIPLPVIYVTHDEVEAHSLGARAIRLTGGRVIAVVAQTDTGASKSAAGTSAT